MDMLCQGQVQQDVAVSVAQMLAKKVHHKCRVMP